MLGVCDGILKRSEARALARYPLIRLPKQTRRVQITPKVLVPAKMAVTSVMKSMTSA